MPRYDESDGGEDNNSTEAASRSGALQISAARVALPNVTEIISTACKQRVTIIYISRPPRT